ncbi:hypothetical protein [Tumebacillus permanentifrigoris]|uniref:RiboL-PSP-HEPN domain-containing protein n=1 Tax=Tumebacillus permanentifrigoris TaxID=378543 RepID=A0A316D472_9BACL|nr:hypothetical protein [Tumebacillus permanentifrigoris]PWK07037.1 hypothetical protein C7459_118111 [Tumebacillus permanentifrigoris]
MNEELKDITKIIVNEFSVRLMQNYDNTALLINACYVSANSYAELRGEKNISTTGGIPVKYRLSQKIEDDLETIFSRIDMVHAYKTTAIDKVIKDYFITTISIVDAFLEELYKLLIKFKDNQADEDKIVRRINSMWTNDNFRIYVLNSGLLKQDRGMLAKNYPISIWFDTYDEFRIIRNCVVHSGGQLTEKQRSKLAEIVERVPHRVSVCNLAIDWNEVILHPDFMYFIRMFTFDFLHYLGSCVVGNIE